MRRFGLLALLVVLCWSSSAQAQFQIPSRDTVTYTAPGGDKTQALWQATDIKVLSAGFGGNYVVSGCQVTAQGTPDMTVAVSTCSAIVAGTARTVSGGNVSITAAHATLARVDTIWVDTSFHVTDGTAADNPKPADLPAGVVLAFVYVPPTDTDIDADQIVDKRVIKSSVVRIDQGTITAAQPALQTTTTWNNGAVGFTGWDLNVTNTASATGSYPFRLRVANNDIFSIAPSGAVWGYSASLSGAAAMIQTGIPTTAPGSSYLSDVSLGFSTGYNGEHGNVFIGSGAGMGQLGANDAGIVNSELNTAVGNNALFFIGQGGTLGSNSHYNVALGTAALQDMKTGSSNIGIGWKTAWFQWSGDNNVYLGHLVYSSPSTSQSHAHSYNTIIGGNSWNNSVNAYGNYNTILGGNASASGGTPPYNYSLGLGYGVVTTASNQAAFGSTAGYLNEFYLGSGVVSTGPQANVTVAATGGSGTDIQGSNLILGGGKGTGSATPRSIYFATSTAEASGTTLQALTNRWWFDGANLGAFTGATGQKITVGSNTLVGSVTDKLNAAHLAIASQAIGDLLYADSTTSFARLAPSSTSGWVLTSNGSGAAPSYQAPTGGGAPTGATYWTSSADSTLTNETNLGLLTTGLVLNTVSGAVGTPSAYGGSSCTNQFARSTNASGAWTCDAVQTADVAANAVTSAKMAVANTLVTKTITIGRDDGPALTDTNLAQARLFMVPYAATIIEVTVASDAGTPNVQIKKNHTGTNTNLLSGVLAAVGGDGASTIACARATTSATCYDGTTSSGTVTISTTSLAAGDWVGLTSGTAGGTAKRLSIAITYAID